MPDNITASAGIGAFPTAPAPRTGATGKLELDSDAFLKLLVAQLKYQDPSNPMDPTAMMAQTAQLAVVDRIDQLLKAQESAAHSSQVGLAASLIGKAAVYRSSAGESVGTVEAVTVAQGGVSLIIDGVKVKLGDLIEVGPSPWELPAGPAPSLPPALPPESSPAATPAEDLPVS
jgi:flagellar basal-body rod modification protein FlgD